MGGELLVFRPSAWPLGEKLGRGVGNSRSRIDLEPGVPRSLARNWSPLVFPTCYLFGPRSPKAVTSRWPAPDWCTGSAPGRVSGLTERAAGPDKIPLPSKCRTHPSPAVGRPGKCSPVN